MPGFAEPNYTQTPNELFDISLPDMSESELKLTLAIIRMTLGFHKSECRASVPTLQQMTGLSHTSIQAGAELGEQRGTLKRHQEPGRTTEWELVLEPEAAKGYKRLTPPKYRGDKDQLPLKNLDDTQQVTPQESCTLSPVKEERNSKEKIAPEAGAGNGRAKPRKAGGTDAIKKGDTLDGMMAFRQPPTGVDLSWLDEYLIPRALVFWQETKIEPMPDERSFWRKELRVQYEAGITVEQIKTACQRMRKDGLTIKSPASIRAVAKDIQANPPAETKLLPELPPARVGTPMPADVRARLEAVYNRSDEQESSDEMPTL